MTTIIPEGAAVRKAVQWVSQMREGEVALAILIEQACVRFNLSPKDSDFMNRFFTEQDSAHSRKD